MKNKIIVILGPTASGKTGWGIKLAQKFKGEIICADSRTVYKYFNLATAKPTKKEMQKVPHHLLDFVDPRKKVYTATDFQRDALKKIKDILKKNRLPIIVGGSALYIYALTRGYRFPGQSDTKLRRELESRSLAELQAIAKKNKKISLNSSDFQNKRRLIRAIEVFENCKFKIKNFRSSPLPYQFLKIGIDL
ncbi:tRNA (adenosine(37)-N6)-dimethylallyltransferase MiaA, partial [Patescibacteria group bacterium]|nr:tRNA (adenosine(37)-N6)-dimethylallyltransferase MiaA [Patescibacteria group bacterium]